MSDDLDCGVGYGVGVSDYGDNGEIGSCVVSNNINYGNYMVLFNSDGGRNVYWREGG